MRKILFVLPLAMLALTGCQQSMCCTHAGWGFWYHKPPTIDQTTPTLLTATIPYNGAHPMGATAGPIPVGQFQQGPTIQAPALPSPMPSGPAKPATNLMQPIGPSCLPRADACKVTSGEE